MPAYRSTMHGRAVWPGLTNPDGTTLELDPGETVELTTKTTAPGLSSCPPISRRRKPQHPQPSSNPTPAATLGCHITQE